MQLPAWNEALGLPRPFDQQWSLRMQQILAYETDLLEYGDIFEGSGEIARKVDALKREAREVMSDIEKLGGAIAAVEMGYMKGQLVESNSKRVEAIERGEQVVVGVNTLHRERALAALDRRRLDPHRGGRGRGRADRAAERLARRARRQGGGRIAARPARGRSLRAQHHAGLDRGREGRRHHRRMGARAARGLRRISRADRRRRAARNESTAPDDVRAEIDRVSKKLGKRLKFLVGKPGLDGHSNGAEQIAVRARDAGMEVVYQGIRLTPAEIVESARDEGVHVVGLSILSGSHVPLVKDVVTRMREAGLDGVPVIVGGIIPPEDASALKAAGVAAVYTPKDYEFNRIMADIVRIVDDGADKAA